MRAYWRLNWIVPVAALAAALTACDGSRKSEPGGIALKNDWKVRANQFAEDAKRDNYRGIKGGFYSYQVKILEDLLDQVPSGVAAAEVERLCAAEVPEFLGQENDLDKIYDHVLLMALIEHNIKQKDARSLRALIESHCPRYVVYSPLEFSLVEGWPESFERLFEWYGSAKNATAKTNIAFCLGRAFPGLRGQFPADAEFVHQARSWYQANGSKLQTNHKYAWLPSQEPPPPGEDTTNLFAWVLQ